MVGVGQPAPWPYAEGERRCLDGPVAVEDSEVGGVVQQH